MNKLWIKLISIYAITTAIISIVIAGFIVPNYFTSIDMTIVDLQPREGRGTPKTCPVYGYTHEGIEKSFKSSDCFNIYNKFLYSSNIGDKVTGYLEDGSKYPIPGKGGNVLTFFLMPGFIVTAITFLFIYFKPTKRQDRLPGN